MNDLKFALQRLFKNPGFTMVAVLTLALGIASSTVVFTIFDRVFLRPLAFPDSERMVTVSLENKAKDGAAVPSLADLRDMVERSESFEAIALYRYDYGTLGSVGKSVTATLGRATPGLFTAFGIQPAWGRGFLPEEHAPGRASVVVLNHELWKTQFGSDSNVLGRVIQLNGSAHTVVGIMPPGFREPWDNAALWVPLQPTAYESQNRYERWGNVVGRLKQGVPMQKARAEAVSIAAALAQEYAASNANLPGARVGSLHAAVTGYGREPVLVVLGASGLILLLSGANTVGLMLLRVASRKKDLATRSALGATRGRLFQLLAAEALLLSLGSAVVAAVFSIWGIHWVLGLLPGGYLPRMGEIQADWGTFAFVAGACGVAGLAVAVLPTLAPWHRNPHAALAGASRGSSSGGGGRFRRGLVIAQLATACSLLTVAGLLASHLDRLARTDLGLRTDNGLTMSLNLPRNQTDSNEKRAAYLDEILRAVQSVPGVKAAAVSTTHPLGWSVGTDLFVEGKPAEFTRDLNVPRDFISPGFFEESGVRLLGGRLFDERDGRAGPADIIINQALSDRLFPNESPIGRRLKLGAEQDARSGEIIGVVGNVRRHGPMTEPEFQMYLSHRVGGFPFVTLIVRTDAGDPALLAPGVQAALLKADKSLFGNQVATLATAARNQTALPRVQSLLVGLFASLAVLVACVGLYALIAHAVGQRTREFGIRSALGAQRRDVFSLVFGEAGKLALWGLCAGAGLSIGLLRLGRAWLQGVPLLNPWVFVGVAAIMATSAFVSSWVPARRAARVDPMEALRNE